MGEERHFINTSALLCAKTCECLVYFPSLFIKNGTGCLDAAKSLPDYVNVGRISMENGKNKQPKEEVFNYLKFNFKD